MDSLWHDLRLVIISAVVFFVGSYIAGRVSVRKNPRGDAEAPKAAAPPVAAQAAPPPARAYIPGPPLKLPDGALYAVITAAVAQALAAEGVNPEGGFTITSVKAL